MFYCVHYLLYFFFFFQAEDGIRDHCVTGVQTCALPISVFVNWLPEICMPSPESPQKRTTARSITCRLGLLSTRSEERRVGKECRSRWWPDHYKKKDI